MTVGKYLVRRLEQMGLRHIFGVPGDYVLKFMDLIEESSLDLVNTCSELNAGYAADAYGRLAGVGAVCITYGVGGFSVYNAVAGAFAERVPLIVISGGPRLSLRGRLHPYLLHHTIGDMNLQHDIFEKITQAAVVLTSPERAVGQIDEVLATCLRTSRPVYLEIPADMVGARCESPGLWRPDTDLHLDQEVLKEAVEETLTLIRAAHNPVILAGVESCRLSANQDLLDVIEHTGFPVATTTLGKGIIPEQLPNFIGTYFGSLANESTRKVVESADLLLCLGAWMTDIDLGGYTANLDPRRLIIANSEKVKVSHHLYDHVPLKDFLKALRASVVKGTFRGSKEEHPANSLCRPFTPVPEARLTTDRFWERMNHFITDNHVLLAETGSAAFDAVKLCLPQKADYISQTFYASIGFSIPAALGVKLAQPLCRPVVFVGDGAFQMTGQELSTIIRLGQNPVIFLLNNDGYQIERVIYDNRYNNLQMWDYTLLPVVYGAAKGIQVNTEGDLESALQEAKERTDSLVFVEVRLDRFDFSETLWKVGERLK
ncbi:MAG: alpha-keto acid decarboxylase family protein [Deltaproteobacteria bacterium]|nr:alpha-keto acid decarboxylase family protein [Deltaproteobacteria bacterium]